MYLACGLTREAISKVTSIIYIYDEKIGKYKDAVSAVNKEFIPLVTDTYV